MKIKFPTLFALCLLLTSCFPDDEIGPDGLKGTNEKGQFVASTKEQARKLIELSNSTSARITDNHAKVITEIILSQNGEEVYRLEYTMNDTLTLPAGTYDFVAQGRWIGGVWDNTLQWQTSYDETITIVAGELTEREFMVTRHAHDVQVELVNLNNAKIWVGPVGFTPSDEWIYNPHATTVYGDAFDVVVEFEGEQKRYTTDARPGSIYLIKITRDDDTEPATDGKAHLNYVFQDRSPVPVNYTW